MSMDGWLHIHEYIHSTEWVGNQRRGHKVGSGDGKGSEKLGGGIDMNMIKIHSIRYEFSKDS